ncbi:MFS transporter [Phytohabitans houttuyneae]|uniref:MFS transporter n=1 Tax=Phytohabitans houttuyneae TaxID=1076126 RepID=A0A6V8KDY9_9ACTN|nr:MFS transporter [Phytohabitans houttuyneae]GFJ83442.1 MFS transporter [Phytohabitans houttuyneae]
MKGLLRRMALDVTPLRTSRDYRLLFAAGGVSGFGSFITYVTIPFQVYALTDDPLLVGLLGVCELVPLLFMAFVGGALADYLDRRALVLGAEVAFTALCGVLLVNALLDSPHLWLLYVVAGLTAAIDGIQRPAMEGLTPRVVTPEQIPAASALNGLRMQIAQLAGPAIAGLLIASIDMAWVYAVDLATFAFSLVCLALVRAVPPPPDAERPSLRSVATGLRYARSRPELLGTYLVDINAMFFGMPQALYPFMAGKLGGPAVLGLLYAAPAVGSLLATVTSGWTGRVHRHGLMVVIAAGLWGVGIIGFGLANWLWLALLCLAFAGAADMVSGIFRMTIWNQTIPDHLRGRLAGIEMISWATGPLLGQLRSGVAARYMGIGGSIISGGVLCVVGTLALAAALPAFLRYDGRDGLARKQAADEEWAARAASRTGA